MAKTVKALLKSEIVIELSLGELLAVRKLIGQMSVLAMEKFGLTEAEGEVVTGVWDKIDSLIPIRSDDDD